MAAKPANKKTSAPKAARPSSEPPEFRLARAHGAAKQLRAELRFADVVQKLAASAAERNPDPNTREAAAQLVGDLECAIALLGESGAGELRRVLNDYGDGMCKVVARFIAEAWPEKDGLPDAEVVVLLAEYLPGGVGGEDLYEEMFRAKDVRTEGGPLKAAETAIGEAVRRATGRGSIATVERASGHAYELCEALLVDLITMPLAAKVLAAKT